MSRQAIELSAQVAQIRAELRKHDNMVDPRVQRYIDAVTALRVHDEQVDAFKTEAAHLIYAKVVQGRQGLLDAVATRAADPRQTTDPAPVFIAILVHNGKQVADAATITRQITEACNLFHWEDIEQGIRAVVENIILDGPEVRRAFNDYLLALSAGLTPQTAADRAPQGLGFDHCVGDSAHDRRVNMLWFLTTLLERMLWESKGLSGIHCILYPIAELESDALKAIIRWLKRLLLQLFALAACRGGWEPSSYGETLDEIIKIWALRYQPVFTRADIRNLRAMLRHPDKRSPAVLNVVTLDDTSSALAARLYGDPIIPRRHGVDNDGAAPPHRLPAANASRIRRERGYPTFTQALSGFYFDDGGKPWDDETKKATTDVIKEMLRQFEPTNADEVQDINDLGNKVWKDPERPTRNYWGFSEEGLAAMKTNREAEKNHATGYGDVPLPERPRVVRSNEIERARELAARSRGGGGGERGRGGRGRGGFRGGRGGYY